MPFFFTIHVIKNKKKKDASQTKNLPLSMRRAGVSASATIEASFILSLMLFAFVALFTPFSTMYTQMKMQSSLEKICSDAAIQCYTGKEDAIYSKTYAKLVLLNSKMQVSSAISKLTIDDGIVDIVTRYSVKISFFPSIKQNFVQRTRRRCWVGRDGLQGNSKNETDETVYVTETGTVYHLYDNCSHIQLSIKTVNYSQLSNLRNTNGGIYHACEKCKPSTGGSVYITDDGDRYHSNSSCSGIKRSVKEVHLSELEGKKVCSRCQARKERER